MSEFTSTKPYMIRAMHEWCVDNGLTPHLLVAVDVQTRVPMAYVKDGEIVLNLNYSATKDLLIGNEAITFSARFGGKASDLYVPLHAVRGIFARENGQGMVFQPETEETRHEVGKAKVTASVTESPDQPPDKPTAAKKPSLKLVK